MSDDDYEALRLRNIAERNAYLKSFLDEIKESTAEINRLEAERLSFLEIEKENTKPRTSRSGTKRRRSQIDKSPDYRKQSIRLEVKRKYNTRSKARAEENNEDEENNLFSGQDIIVSNKASNIKIMFPWARPIQRDIDLMKFDFDDDNDDEQNSGDSDNEIYFPRKRVLRMSKSTYDPNSIPSPDEITESMLKNIAAKASGKKYDAINGTSCHQCRQKTRDTKTVCRSGECIGVRGQFCGPCLKGRYGESALEALKDPLWACPPCRGLCNCSICRTRNGQRPTGILAPTAKEEGFNSVKDYLQAMDCKGDDVDSDDGNDDSSNNDDDIDISDSNDNSDSNDDKKDDCDSNDSDNSCNEKDDSDKSENEDENDAEDSS